MDVSAFSIDSYSANVAVTQKIVNKSRVKKSKYENRNNQLQNLQNIHNHSDKASVLNTAAMILNELRRGGTSTASSAENVKQLRTLGEISSLERVAKKIAQQQLQQQIQVQNPVV